MRSWGRSRSRPGRRGATHGQGAPRRFGSPRSSARAARSAPAARHLRRRRASEAGASGSRGCRSRRGRSDRGGRSPRADRRPKRWAAPRRATALSAPLRDRRSTLRRRGAHQRHRHRSRRACPRLPHEPHTRRRRAVGSDPRRPPHRPHPHGHGGSPMPGGTRPRRMSGRFPSAAYGKPSRTDRADTRGVAHRSLRLQTEPGQAGGHPLGRGCRAEKGQPPFARLTSRRARCPDRES